MLNSEMLTDGANDGYADASITDTQRRRALMAWGIQLP